jgi:hypothetical protein
MNVVFISGMRISKQVTVYLETVVGGVVKLPERHFLG